MVLKAIHIHFIQCNGLESNEKFFEKKIVRKNTFVKKNLWKKFSEVWKFSEVPKFRNVLKFV